MTTEYDKYKALQAELVAYAKTVKYGQACNGTDSYDYCIIDDAVDAENVICGAKQTDTPMTDEEIAAAFADPHHPIWREMCDSAMFAAQFRLEEYGLPLMKGM